MTTAPNRTGRYDVSNAVRTLPGIWSLAVRTAWVPTAFEGLMRILMRASGAVAGLSALLAALTLTGCGLAAPGPRAVGPGPPRPLPQPQPEPWVARRLHKRPPHLPPSPRRQAQPPARRPT